tara:strand:+ start:929 stop:1948 length:1020 start_codon:yes stop_codon:yes gene_type:complete
MIISDFNYTLPNELIAKHPATNRRDSRFLVLGNSISDRRFNELPDLIRPNDLLVFNDTRVIKARLFATKETGGKVEILIERILGVRSVLAHLKSNKPIKLGKKLILAENVKAEVLNRRKDLFELQFSTEILSFIESYGKIPLPPYIDRSTDISDDDRYQTVYARDPGAIAAPTAGLHFDQRMLEETAEAGANHSWLTLHVGAGTFQNLREQQIRDNRLHSERVEVNEVCCEAVRKAKLTGGRVIAVGTTSVRALECASKDGMIKPYNGETNMFIFPGFKFNTVDAMITNFHLPKSSLLMLVAAFSGKNRILDAYKHAVREKYRFFSYGDAMFLTPDKAR